MHYIIDISGCRHDLVTDPATIHQYTRTLLNDVLKSPPVEDPVVDHTDGYHVVTVPSVVTIYFITDADMIFLDIWADDDSNMPSVIEYTVQMFGGHVVNSGARNG